jgi:hypothetical protein
MTGDTPLARFVARNAAGYALTRPGLAADLAARFPATLKAGVRDEFDVGNAELDLSAAIIAAGSQDAAAFTPLVAAVTREADWLQRNSPGALQPNLSVLGVINGLQVMGIPLPASVADTGRGWLVGMDSAGQGPDWMHWTRGLAALALGDLSTARTIAALPRTGSLPAELPPDPQFNVQEWLALFVISTEQGVAWSLIEERWRALLTLAPTLLDVGELAKTTLPWLGRVAGTLAGRPVAEIADWLHAEIARVAADG